jgi:hypothetical protein
MREEVFLKSSIEIILILEVRIAMQKNDSKINKVWPRFSFGTWDRVFSRVRDDSRVILFQCVLLPTRQRCHERFLWILRKTFNLIFCVFLLVSILT